MCCMLSTFHVSSWIVANISESSLLFSQYRFRPCWGVVNKYLYFFFGRVELWFGQVQMPYHSSEGRVHPKFCFYHWFATKETITCCGMKRSCQLNFNWLPKIESFVIGQNCDKTGPVQASWSSYQTWGPFNILRPRQDGRHFPDVIFKCIFLNENVLISIKFSLKFVPKGQINNIPTLV